MRSIDARKAGWPVAGLRCAAFTLIEVTIATGLVAFALVGILGALPLGLQTMQDAQARQVTGSIAQQMQANLQQLSFGSTSTATTNIKNLSSLNLYYTVDGMEVPATNPAVYYRAEFLVAKSQVVSQGNSTTFGTPAPPTDPTQPNNSQTVTITLKYPQVGATIGPKSVVYSFVLARQRID